KANELRNGKYYHESRVLYLSLLEDIQASNPILADLIRFELLHTDLARFFNSNVIDVDDRLTSELELKCLQLIRTLDKQPGTANNTDQSELAELACLFLLEHSFGSIKEFAN